MPNPLQNTIDRLIAIAVNIENRVKNKVNKLKKVIDDKKTTENELDNALCDYLIDCTPQSWHKIFKREMKRHHDWVKENHEKNEVKEPNSVENNNFYTLPMIDELKIRIDEQNRAFEETYLSHQIFIDELKQVLQSQEIAHQLSLDEIKNRSAESSLVINPLDKNKTSKEIKRLQEKLIKQKTITEELKDMFYDLLKRLDELVTTKTVQSINTSAIIPMEEKIGESKRLSFF